MSNVVELDKISYEIGNWYGTLGVKVDSIGVKEEYIEKILLDMADQLMDKSHLMVDSIINVHSIGIMYRGFENEMVVTFLGNSKNLVVKAVDFRSEYDYLIVSVYTC